MLYIKNANKGRHAYWLITLLGIRGKPRVLIPFFVYMVSQHRSLTASSSSNPYHISYHILVTGLPRGYCNLHGQK